MESADLIALAHAIAPEIQRPLYVVTSGEAGLSTGIGSLLGATCRSLDLLLRPAIGELWRGRGWCILIRRSGDVGTFLHELSHVLDGTMPWIEFDGSPVAGKTVKRLHELVSAHDSPVAGRKWRGRDTHHGEAFHRAMVHVTWRARAVGVCVGWHELGASVPQMWRIAKTLAGECEHRRGDTFESIMDTPPPGAFTILYRRLDRQGKKMSGTALIAALKDHESSRDVVFDDLVKSIAHGEAIPEDGARAILADCGKTAADLEGAVDLMRRRRDAVKTLKRLAPLDGESRTAADLLNEASKIFDAANAAWNDAENQYEFEKQRIAEERRECEEARRFLQTTAPPAVLSAARDAAAMRQSAGDAATKLRKDSQVVREHLRSAENDLRDAIARKDMVAREGYIGPRLTEKQASERVDRLKADLERKDRELIAATTAAEDADKNATAARAAMLKP